MKHKMTAKEQLDRSEARWEIIQEANKHKMRSRMHPWHHPLLYGMKNIHRAVFYSRQHMIVSPDLLRRAGFTPKALRPNKPAVLDRLLGRK